jgi:hypothetical protein
MASAEAMMALSVCCDMMYTKNTAQRPVCIASRHHNFLNLDPYRMSGGGSGDEMAKSALQPYESLRMHCKSLNHAALARLHLQMALYVHPVIRSDELALSAAIQAGKISKPTETVETRHRAEAELRSVFTIFIKAIMSPKITGMAEVDEELYQKLADVMHVTSRELDRYSGHLRQFIVDDKGVVLIATFGLRGSTFPNMVSNNGLPAVFAIHRALKTELNVENRIAVSLEEYVVTNLPSWERQSIWQHVSWDPKLTMGSLWTKLYVLSPMPVLHSRVSHRFMPRDMISQCPFWSRKTHLEQPKRSDRHFHLQGERRRRKL